MDLLAEIMIAIFSISAVGFSQQRAKQRRRWASVCGLIAQPFWFWTTWSNEQYIVFGLCIVYTYIWYTGFRTYWLEERG